ncbi:MAG: NFACT RNA binding domain-containing protein [Myxococcales bacterium]|nr:NFACT RNA binding domain-containing protein [Myxococcales bacterium]
MDLPATLKDARIRRVDRPAGGLFAISMARGTERLCLLIGLDEPARGLGLSPTRPSAGPADAFTRALRKHTEGCRIQQAELEAGALRLELARGPEQRTLVCVLYGTRGNLRLLAHDHEPLLQLRSQSERDRTSAAPPSEIDAQQLLSAAQQADLEQRRRHWRKAAARHRRKLQRKLTALATDIARGLQAPELRARAGLLLSNLHAIDDRAEHVSVTDYGCDRPRAVEIAIDPRLGARAQAEAWYRQARRFERGATIGAERQLQAQQERAQLEAALERLDLAADEESLRLAGEALDQLGITTTEAAEATRPAAGQRRAAPGSHSGGRRPYREFRSAAGEPILVGRGARDNDRLTTEVARPQDLWLHARGLKGAHVVVPRARGQDCPPELLLDAATLAAHFSTAKGDATVEIAYTPRRYVRKPRKAPAGLVVLEREKVLLLELEPERRARLLGSERELH